MATKTKKNGKSKTQDEIYQSVTDRIVQSLEEDAIPWHKPWRSRGGHMNLISKRPYRGINPFLLEVTAIKESYESPYWVTYKQAKSLGGHVKKDEKSTLIIFWKILKFKEDAEDEEDSIKTIPLLKHINVFNVEQCEGFEDKIPEPEEAKFTPIEAAEKLDDEMKNRPTIKHRQDHAFYVPAADYIGLPDPEQFDTPEHYYCTRWHELGHSTGHKDRLNREGVQSPRFGSDPYAKEELVAEMSAAMCAGVAGIDVVPQIQENQKAYIKSWIKRFKDDTKLLISSAAQAQKAANYIMNVKEADNA
jgi:antirestriction protein ArdC